MNLNRFKLTALKTKRTKFIAMTRGSGTSFKDTNCSVCEKIFVKDWSNLFTMVTNKYFTYLSTKIKG